MNITTESKTATGLTAGPSAAFLAANHREKKMNNQRKRILVVDDESSITRLLKLNLEQTGAYEVATENVSQAALEAAERFQPDLILLDMIMPGLDGGHLASMLQESPRLKGVPIVFLTAAGPREDQRGGRTVVGGLPYLAKPVNLQEVLVCLHHYLGPDGHPQPNVAPFRAALQAQP